LLARRSQRATDRIRCHQRHVTIKFPAKQIHFVEVPRLVVDDRIIVPVSQRRRMLARRLRLKNRPNLGRGIVCGAVILL
jgi:hypothetical protein